MRNVVSERKKRDISLEPKVVCHKPVLEYILAHELDWWLQKKSRNDARKTVNAKCHSTYTPKEWPNVVYYQCKIYGKWRRKHSAAKDLDCLGWEKLKSAVESLSLHLQGRPFTEALQIVQSRVGCNAELLRGLPKRFHFWV